MRKFAQRLVNAGGKFWHPPGSAIKYARVYFYRRGMKGWVTVGNRVASDEALAEYLHAKGIADVTHRVL
jgi:hypothetical protein